MVWFPQNEELWTAVHPELAHLTPNLEVSPLTDKLELWSDVLHEERHVVGEVELGGGEDERVGEDSGAAQPVHLQNAHRVSAKEWIL